MAERDLDRERHGRRVWYRRFAGGLDVCEKVECSLREVGGCWGWGSESRHFRHEPQRRLG